MTVTAPETMMRELVLDALNKEFEGEIEFIDDKLHPALGVDGPIGGAYPAERTDMANNQLVVEITCYIQLFLKWDKQIDPKQTVSPKPIEEAAERVARAIEAVEPNEHEAGPHLWEAHVVRILYPQDPTGNMTRLEATVFGRAQNPALVQTNG